MKKYIGSKKELIGKSRVGNTTKVHAGDDGLVNPVKVTAQVYDITVALKNKFSQDLSRYIKK